VRKALFTFTLAIILISSLYWLGFFYVSIAPHNSYKLSKHESEMIESAILRFRKLVENQNYDEIKSGLLKAGRDEYAADWIIRDIKANRAEYGTPLDWEFFRCAQPQVDSELGGTVYHLDYLTRFSTREIYEGFIWEIVNGEIYLVHTDIYDLPQATDWRVRERDDRNAIVWRYPRDVTIPFSDRYIEIRY
jgi:hypothetical protein